MSKNPNVIDVYFGHPDHQPAQNAAQQALEDAAGGRRPGESGRQARKRGAVRVGLAAAALTALGTQTAVNSAPEQKALHVAAMPGNAAAGAVEKTVGKVLDPVLFPSPLGKGDAYTSYDMTGEGNYKVYTIKPGDTEWGIASATGLDPQHIDKLEHNLIDPQLPKGMDAGNLDPGTTLRLPLDSAIGQVPKK